MKCENTHFCPAHLSATGIGRVSSLLMTFPLTLFLTDFLTLPLTLFLFFYSPTRLIPSSGLFIITRSTRRTQCGRKDRNSTTENFPSVSLLWKSGLPIYRFTNWVSHFGKIIFSIFSLYQHKSDGWYHYLSWERSFHWSTFWRERNFNWTAQTFFGLMVNPRFWQSLDLLVCLQVKKNKYWQTK